MTFRALPQTEGAIEVDGLNSSVTVLRDEAGIVRILGEDPHDLFLAQGYVHAQERLWQMEVWRHISAGRLSELFGESTLDQDRFIRTLGWRQAAQRDLDAVGAGTGRRRRLHGWGERLIDGHGQDNQGLAFVVTALQSGSGGVGGYPWNRGLRSIRSPGRRSRAGSSVATSRPRSSGCSPTRSSGSGPHRRAVPAIPGGHAGHHADAAATTGRHSAIHWRQARAGRRPSSPPPEADAWRDVTSIDEGFLRLAGLDGGEGIASDHQVGSNNWVVAPSKSSSGGALLANDPHLGISMPSSGS